MDKLPDMNRWREITTASRAALNRTEGTVAGNLAMLEQGGYGQGETAMWKLRRDLAETLCSALETSIGIGQSLYMAMGQYTCGNGEYHPPLDEEYGLFCDIVRLSEILERMLTAKGMIVGKHRESAMCHLVHDSDESIKFALKCAHARRRLADE